VRRVSSVRNLTAGAAMSKQKKVSFLFARNGAAAACDSHSRFGFTVTPFSAGNTRSRRVCELAAAQVPAHEGHFPAHPSAAAPVAVRRVLRALSRRGHRIRLRRRAVRPTVSKNPPAKLRIGGAGRRCQARGEGGQRVAPSERMNFTERTVSRWKTRTSNGRSAFSVARRLHSLSSRYARRASSASLRTA